MINAFFKSRVPVAKWLPIMPSRRLLLAYVASLSLHALLLVGGTLPDRRQPATTAPRTTPAMLEAKLTKTPEPVLKDTLATAEAPTAPAQRTSPTTASGRKSVAAARRQLAEHLYYPPEAIARGLEGEVRLLLTLAPDGTVTDATVAASSGHALLDQAAVRAAHAMGRLVGADRREVLLPVMFRLRP